MGRVERQRDLARKRTRRAKLRRLREKYRKANESDRPDIIEKVRLVSPLVNLVEEEAAREKADAK